MKFLIISIFCVSFYFSVNGQSITELNVQLTEFFTNKEFDKALPIAKRIVVDVKDKYGELSLEYVTVLNNLALIYVGLQEMETAEELFVKVIELHSQIPSADDSDYCYKLNELAKFYMERKRYDKAVPLFIKLLEKP